MHSLSTLGERITLNLQVDNTGPSIIPNSTLEVRLPGQVVTNGSSNYALYPSRIMARQTVNMLSVIIVFQRNSLFSYDQLTQLGLLYLVTLLQLTQKI